MRRTLVALGVVVFWFGACGGNTSSDEERHDGSGGAGSESGVGGRSSGSGGDSFGGSGGDPFGGSSGDPSGGSSGDPSGGSSGDPSGGSSSDPSGGGRAGAIGGSAGATASGAAPGTAGSAGSAPELQPCDVTHGASACLDGVCAGAPYGGFFCRPLCPDDAHAGDRCGDSGICLQTHRYDPRLACYEVSDCDFVTSQGCDRSADESCLIVDVARFARVCAPAGELELGELCDGGAGAPCVPGLACLGSDIIGGEPGRCAPLCHPGEPLPSDCAECIALTDEVGSCAECSVLADDCNPGTEHCNPVSELLGGVCVEFGPGEAGDECTFEPSASCQEGHLCVGFEDVVGPAPMACVEICDPATTDCALPGYYCNDVGLFMPSFATGELALCIDSVAQFCAPSRSIECRPGADCILPDGDEPGVCLSACDPTNGDAACEDDFACLPFVDDTFFQDAVLHGNGVCGTGCEGNSDCGDEETCLQFAGLDSAGLCARACDPSLGDPCGNGDACVVDPGSAASSGCVPSDAICDPTAAVDSCDVGLTCMAWTDSSTGLCLPACHVENPDWCEEGVTCVEKTGELWHQGVCWDSNVPCDPIAQTGCGAGETCRVVGGPGIGGYAFSCEESG